ncbi:hypothetical protein BB561_006912 [Smittium simulii]|uniref:Antiviral helicase SKI2 n=1 Tax=Smittium simulii TaxID=133385 RepID=A0A2T9Y058_9FUNG|nr:hypothetical protein BB561_006912 [Smittium simulii]
MSSLEKIVPKIDALKERVGNIQLISVKTGSNNEFDLLADNLSLLKTTDDIPKSESSTKASAQSVQSKPVNLMTLESETPAYLFFKNNPIDFSDFKCLPNIGKNWNKAAQKETPCEASVDELLEDGFEQKPWVDIKWKRNIENHLIESSFEDNEVDNKLSEKSKKVLSFNPIADSNQKIENLTLLSDISDNQTNIDTNQSLSISEKALIYGNDTTIDAQIDWKHLWSNTHDESTYFATAPGLDYGLDKSLSTSTNNYFSKVDNPFTSESLVNKYEEIEKRYGDEHINTDKTPDPVDRDSSNKLESTDEKNNTVKLTGDVNFEHRSIDQVLQNIQKMQLFGTDINKIKWAIQVDCTRGTDHITLDKENYPIKFDFELDPFQKEAVWCLENNESVFVAAHTSAGKTVVAEYAIALSKQHMTKTIYTSPIKALSNQKYRDFCKKFGTEEIGIITGDIQIRPEARCLVMTTEVLRSMLYRGSDVLNDVEYVVFDEVHYINDMSRGVVWEEVLIMLPSHITLVLLSATVPNTLEFSEWIGRTRRTKIHVISTPKRPVPLEHYLYLPDRKFNDRNATEMANNGFYKIVDADGKFDPIVYKKFMGDINKKSDNDDSSNSRNDSNSRGRVARSYGSKTNSSFKINYSNSKSVNSQNNSGTYIWSQLINKLRSLDLLPCVFFVFSRKKCEEYSNGLPNVNFLTASERSQVHLFIKSSLSRLSEHDMKLPQISAMTDLLLRGIGSHHSGLLPILKEIVELLFSNNYIKVLFATETFAMGVNSPTRTVVFTMLKKSDGVEFRHLNSGEYTQMSGRAGRRGIDTSGVVIIASEPNQLKDSASLNKMILGAPNKLQSQFKLSYTMILNLLISKQLGVEDMIRKSFSEDSNVKRHPLKLKALNETQEEINSLPELSCIVCKPDIKSLYDLCTQLNSINYNIFSLFVKKNDQTKFNNESLFSGNFKKNIFTKGRILVVNFNGLNYFPAFYVQTQYENSVINKMKTRSLTYSLNDMLIDKPSEYWITIQIVVNKDEKKLIEDYINTLIISQADTSFSYLTKDCIPPIPLLTGWNTFYQKRCFFLFDTPNLELLSIDVPISSIVEVTDYVFRESLNNMEKHIQSFTKLHNNVKELTREKSMYDFKKNIKTFDAASHFKEIHNSEALESKMEIIKYSLSEVNLELVLEYKKMLEVLLHKGYIDSKNNVTLKGRVASQFNTCEPLVLTEMILNNSLSKYNEYEIAAILSAFVCQVKQNRNVLSFDSSFFESLGIFKNGKHEEEFDEFAAVMKVKNVITELASDIIQLEKKFEIKSNLENAMEENYNFALSKLVYKWAQGTNFYLLSEHAGEAQEGIITRTILRLSENLLEVAAAAKIVGNLELCEKVKNAITLIKRDIVFVTSLYY